MTRFGWFFAVLAAGCLAACGNGGNGGNGGGGTPPPVNQVPTANAGPDQSPLINATVTLDGRASSDADGDALTYSWSITAPDSSVVTLGSPTTAQPSLVVAQVGTYVATLTVSDGKALSAADTVNIAVPNPWTSLSPLPTARTESYAIAVGSKIYVLGGRAANAPVAKVDIYDTVSGTWSVGSPDPEPREGEAFAAVGTKIYTLGGGPRGSTSAAIPPQVPTVGIFDTVAGTWSDGPDMPTGRSALTVGVVGNVIYAINGIRTYWYLRDYAGTHPVLNEALDTVTGTWRTAPSHTFVFPNVLYGGVPTPFDSGGSAAIGQTMFLMGINTQHSTLSGAPNLTFLQFDATTGVWTLLGIMPRWTPRIVAFGGKIYAVSDRVDRYDPTTGEWATAKAPAPADLDITTTARGPVALVGSKIYIFNASGLRVYDLAKDAF